MFTGQLSGQLFDAFLELAFLANFPINQVILFMIYDISKLLHILNAVYIKDSGTFKVLKELY